MGARRIDSAWSTCTLTDCDVVSRSQTPKEGHRTRSLDTSHSTNDAPEGQDLALALLNRMLPQKVTCGVRFPEF